MRVLVIENEKYLAQNIANKLSELECVISSSFSQELKLEHFDVVVASMESISGGYQELARSFESAIIILMIPYINDDMVTKPLQVGITDYIVKPFVIDELVRKIRHYKSYKDLKKEVTFYQSYFNFIERILSTPNPIAYNPSFIIKTNFQRSADIYAMLYARHKGIKFDFLTLKEEAWRDVFKAQPPRSQVFYITHLEELKKTELKDFYDLMLKYSCIVSFVTNEKIAFSQVVDITDCGSNTDIGGEILSVKDYEKYVIQKFETRYPDVELAKKLGMSRKSLWEKRKKYGLERRKESLYSEKNKNNLIKRK